MISRLHAVAGVNRQTHLATAILVLVTGLAIAFGQIPKRKSLVMPQTPQLLRINSSKESRLLNNTREQGGFETMTNKAIALAFVERINAHDVEGLVSLMTDDHVFIDPHGNRLSGKEKLIAGWKGYFEWFPDYRIEVNDILQGVEAVALFGFAGGSLKNKSNASWRLPAAWKAIVKNGRISLWQVFADTKIPFDIVNNNK